MFLKKYLLLHDGKGHKTRNCELRPEVRNKTTKYHKNEYSKSAAVTGGKMFPYLIEERGSNKSQKSDPPRVRNVEEERNESNCRTQNDVNAYSPRYQNYLSPLSPDSSPPKSPTSKKAGKTKREYDYKSEAAKKVEMIARSRDERRQRQADEKALKEQILHLEQNNPNWEFAKMIGDFRSSLEFRPLRDGDPIIENQITVGYYENVLEKVLRLAKN